MKYGKTKPFKTELKPYCYTTSGRNISTHWRSRARQQKNSMIGQEFNETIKEQILKDFGLLKKEIP